jgi:hypothetical protein
MKKILMTALGVLLLVALANPAQAAQKAITKYVSAGLGIGVPVVGFGGESSGKSDFSVDGSRPFDIKDSGGKPLGDYAVSGGTLNITSAGNGENPFLVMFPDSAINSDYEVQVKIKVGTSASYMAGLSFRYQSDKVNPGNISSYGVSFLRGGGGSSQIPDFTFNVTYPLKTYIVLWEEDASVEPKLQTIIAWKDISADSSSGIISSGKIEPWSTLLVRVRQVTVGLVKSNLISVYYADAGSSTTGSVLPTDYIRKDSPIGGLSQVVGCAKDYPWPPNNITDWTAAVDYFTVVQWDGVSAKGTLSADGAYPNTIVKTTGTDLDFITTNYEFGIHAFGSTATTVSFDDFAYRISGAGGASCTPITYTLTATPPVNGKITAGADIDCGLVCTKAYAANTAVTLTAVPNSGYQFGSWGGACSGTSTASCIVTMSADKSVTANFDKKQWKLTTAVSSGSGTVTPSCPSPTGCTYNDGDTVTLTAKSSSGYAFSSWSDAGSRIHNITMDGDKDVSAKFSAACTSGNYNSTTGQTTHNFTSSGTLACPAGVSIASAVAEAIGGGGQGGNATKNKKAGGAGGGAYAVTTFLLSGGAGGVNYTVTVGSSGTSGATAATTTAGGVSLLKNASTTFVSATGGGSVVQNGGHADGGSSSTSTSIGDDKHSGGNGADASGSNSGGGGGGAGQTNVGGNASGTTGGTGNTPGGNGGGGLSSAGTGSAGNTYGGGGGGAIRGSSNGTTAGGTGGKGVVIITYY